MDSHQLQLAHLVPSNVQLPSLHKGPLSWPSGASFHWTLVAWQFNSIASPTSSHSFNLDFRSQWPPIGWPLYAAFASMVCSYFHTQPAYMTACTFLVNTALKRIKFKEKSSHHYTIVQIDLWVYWQQSIEYTWEYMQIKLFCTWLHAYYLCNIRT
jgi:hypothetical protein